MHTSPYSEGSSGRKMGLLTPALQAGEELAVPKGRSVAAPCLLPAHGEAGCRAPLLCSSVATSL